MAQLLWGALTFVVLAAAGCSTLPDGLGDLSDGGATDAPAVRPCDTGTCPQAGTQGAAAGSTGRAGSPGGAAGAGGAAGNKGGAGTQGAAGALGAAGMMGGAGMVGTAGMPGGIAGMRGGGGMGGGMPPGGGGMNGQTCGSMTCAPQQVCCMAPLQCANMCVPDCRLGGACPNGMACSQSTGVCQPPGGMGGMGGMAGMPGGMAGMPGGMAGMPGGMGGAGASGSAGSAGTSGGSCTAPAASGSGCTLTENTSASGTTNSGCALLNRDTSGCAACRSALGLSGFWLKLSCRVPVAVISSGGSTWVQLKPDGLPDYKSAYFQNNNACYTTTSNNLNPSKIATQSLTLYIPATPNQNSQTMTGAVVGIAVNGVPIFANFAAPGDDIYLEAQHFDECQGHPQNTGMYHYHSEPYSISHDDANLVGVMRDGHPLYGRRDMDNSLPLLDGYGGHTAVTPDSNGAAIYHYHVNLQTSTATTSLGMQRWFLTTGGYRGTPGSCSGCN